MRDEEFDQYADDIETIYQASATAQTWTCCLDILYRATGAIGAVFCDIDQPIAALVSESLRETNQLYRARWWRDDVFVATVFAQPQKPGLVHDDVVDGRFDRETHPFFRDFLRARGFGRFVAYFSPVLFGARYALLIQRSLDSGAFAATELSALALLAPHVTRSLAIAGQMRVAQSKDEALMVILDKLTYGAMIVGANNRVVACNETASTLLGDGLTLQDGRLIETASNPRGLMEGLVRLAGESGKSNSVLLHRPSGRRPLVVQAFTFPHVLPWTSGQASDSTLLMLIDTESPSSARQATLVQSFGLTLAEARVATIVGAGFSPVEAAEQLGSAAGTVRTQLKNVFNKLDLKRQSELVRLMTKLEVFGG